MVGIRPSASLFRKSLIFGGVFIAGAAYFFKDILLGDMQKQKENFSFLYNTESMEDRKLFAAEVKRQRQLQLQNEK